MEDGASLPLALHQLESAIDDEADPSVLRAVRQRLMERLTARINELEEFSVTLLRPSGDSRTLSGCLPDDLLEALREKAAREFGIPRDAIVLCRGSRQFAVKELRMSLADVGVGRGTELTCFRDAGCRTYWRLQIVEEVCEWEALIYNVELYDQFNTLIPFAGIESVACNGERNGRIARNAFDGRSDTFWETLFGSEKVGTWVTCKLREAAAIRRIRVKQGNAGNAIRAFEVLCSEDGQDWVSVWTARDMGPHWSASSAPQELDDTRPVSALT